MKWSQMVLLIGLLIGAVMDIKEKQISVFYIIMMGILGSIIRVLCGNVSLFEISGGIGIGCFFMLLSFFSKGGIGMGDGLLILTTGIHLGLRNNLILAGYGLFFSSLYSGVLLVLRKDKKKTIPFVPFLCLGYLCLVIL